MQLLTYERKWMDSLSIKQELLKSKQVSAYIDQWTQRHNSSTFNSGLVLTGMIS